MNKLKRFYMIPVVMLGFLCTVGWASEQLELTAPGGGEMDLSRNIAKYYSTSTQPVAAQWKDVTMQVEYLEYDRTAEVVHGKGKVRLIQNLPEKRSLKCNEITIDLRKEMITASQGVVAQLDNQTSASGGYLEWDRPNDWFKLTENPQVHYEDWKLTGKVMEGKPGRGVMIITGQVYGESKDIIIKGDKLTVDRQAEQMILQDNPVIIQGKNELAATEIIYDLKTKKVTAKGMIKSRAIH
jgi:lipopolysaccharide export system protein LptA